MPAAPPAADSKKPATPPPDKASADKAKAPAAGKAAEAPGGKAGAQTGKAAETAQGGQAARPPQGGAKPAAPGPAAGAQDRLHRMAVRAKLAVSEPGDAVEREADAVADKVMRMADAPAAGHGAAPQPAAGAAPVAAGPKPEVARKADAGAVDSRPAAPAAGAARPAAADKLPGVASGHPKPASTEGTRGGAATKGAETAPAIARSPAGAPSPTAGAATDAAGRLSVPADFADQLGAGEPLDAQTRAFFEQRLQADLSGVRVHTDATADRATRQIQARAFTFGPHIAFASGQYQPGSEAGKRLLAHELAHVRQQDGGGVTRQVMAKAPPAQGPEAGADKRPETSAASAAPIRRQAAGSAPAGGDPNDIALKGVKIPAFKLPYYDKAPYRRKANYRRSEQGSKQTKLWKDGTKAARDNFPSSFGLKDGGLYVALPKKTTLSVANPDLLVGEPKMIGELVQRPKWRRDGTPNPHDIDHKVELQIGGPDMDRLDNLELRDSKANQASGRDIDADITAKLKLVKDKENGDPDKIRANPDYSFVFSDFASGGGADSSAWKQEDINKGEAADGLNVYDPDASADAGKVKAWPQGVDKEGFFGAPDLLVLYPSRRGGQPQKIKLDANGKPKGSGQLPTGWIPGFTINSFDLVPGAADTLGKLKMSFAIQQFPSGYDLPEVPIRSLSSKLTHAGFVSVEGIRNRIGAMLNAKTPVPQASPVTVDEESIDILPGVGLTLDGQINPSVAILGSPIDFSVRGKTFELSKTFTAGELKIPGPFKVTASSLTVALNSSTGFSVTGIVAFAIPKLGQGSLKGTGRMNGFRIAGDFEFDKALFDGEATLSAVYEKSAEAGKFSGTAKLSISEKKIKGITKATITATVADEQFTLDGNAETSIPGIKTFGVGIKFVDAENFSITGKGDFENLPGIESGSLTMTLDRAGDAWELSGKGNAVPKLPGGASGSIDGSYRKGVVLVRGKVHFSYGDGLLDGNVNVAVTNAESVDKEGNPSGEGGKGFKVFGDGKLKAVLIKDRLDGNLTVKLLPDGGVRVGGSLDVKPFEVFGKYPKDGGEFFNKEISTPPVPLPGLGFSVGSVSVGITFSASLTLKAHAAVGPGKLEGITLGVEEFDPANADLKTLKFKGGGNFVVYADAGFSAKAALNLIFGAAVAELVGSVGAEASVGLPPDKPVLSAHADFTYSANDGLDLGGTMNLTIAPALKFRLFGEVSARLNLLVDTVTVWSKDWTLAEANYQLPVGINATGKLGYNSKTGKITPENPSDAITVEKPKLDGDAMKGVLMGDSAPAKVTNTTEPGAQPGPTVNPKRSGAAAAGGAEPPPAGEDEGLVQRLGTGAPLDGATRGFFEQQLQADFSRVQVHTGPLADRESQALAARAFTVGEHIAFAAGQYQPDASDGKALLAHELTHVRQQQGGGSPASDVMRLPTGPGSTTPATGTGATAPAESPGQRSARTRRELAQLVLPVSKRRHGHAYAQWLASRRLKHGPNYDREAVPPAQVGKWETSLRGMATQPAWTGHYSRLGLSASASGPQTITFTGGHPESKTFSDWVDFFMRPQWNHQGTWLPHRLEVDHIVELQTAGWPGSRDGDEPANYELLDKSTNASAGGTIYIGLRQKMRNLLAAERSTDPANPVRPDQVPLRPGSSGTSGPPDAETELKNRGADFTDMEGGAVDDGRGGGRRSDAASAFWVLSELQAGEHLAAIHSPTAGSGGSGNAQQFLLLSAATSGMEVTRIATHGGREVDITGSTARRLASVQLRRASFNDGYGTAAGGTAIGTLSGTWALPAGITPATPDITFNLLKAQDGQFNGWLQPPASFSANASGLSPITFGRLGLDGTGFNATGQLVPSVPLFGRQPIDVTWTHGDIRFGRTFSAENLNLAVPGISLDAASVSVYFDSRGFGAEGAVYFTLAHIGSGVLTVGVDSAGRFSAEGRVDLDTRMFDEANLRVWYREGAFGGSGHVGIRRPGRIRGVNAASIDVTADATHIAATGTVQPAIPGVQNAALSASYGPAQGLVAAGDLQLASVAGIREGNLHAELRKQDGDWHLRANGRAVPALPGITSEITVAYADGLFDGSLGLDFQESIFSGQVTVGLTNRPVSPDGEVTGPAPAEGVSPGGGASDPHAGALSLYGAGNVTARPTPWLEGSVGVKVRPIGDLLINGRIGIPQAVTVFEQYPSPERARRNLFTMPTISVPLVGVAVGGKSLGLALTVNGRVDGHAQVGPGRLTQTQLDVEDFNPAQPESLHLTGAATFNLAAEAGVRATLDAGVSLSAAVLRATVGLDASAGALLQTSVTPAVQLDWRPNSGLHLHADLDAALSPRLAFDVNGYAEVVADAWVTSFSLWRKDWKLDHREVGSSLALRMHTPVDYYSDGRGVVFDPNQVQLDVPELNLDLLDQLFNGEGGSEQAEQLWTA